MVSAVPFAAPVMSPLVRQAEPVTSTVPVIDVPDWCSTNVIFPVVGGGLVRLHVPVQVPAKEPSSVAGVVAATAGVVVAAAGVVGPAAGVFAFASQPARTSSATAAGTARYRRTPLVLPPS